VSVTPVIAERKRFLGRWFRLEDPGSKRSSAEPPLRQADEDIRLYAFYAKPVAKDALPHHHRNPFPCGNPLTIRRNHDVAIRARGRGDVS
jgi:hypothetical protein